MADWFDPRVGGHATLDNTMAGTIYRIAPKGFKSKVPKFDLETTAGQIAALKSPAVNVRYSGFSRLKAQGEKAVPAVAALLKDENPYIAARAVWLLAQLGPTGVAKVKPLLDSKSDTLRLVAYRALRTAKVDVLAMAAKMAGDKSAAVRREVALTPARCARGPEPRSAGQDREAIRRQGPHLSRGLRHRREWQGSGSLRCDQQGTRWAGGKVVGHFRLAGLAAARARGGRGPQDARARQPAFRSTAQARARTRSPSCNRRTRQWR
ncbi:MAG: hypothetical protein WDN28_10265 [Chthoniobacter sp.]